MAPRSSAVVIEATTEGADPRTYSKLAMNLHSRVKTYRRDDLDKDLSVRVWLTDSTLGQLREDLVLDRETVAVVGEGL
jgi:hypothetical protein